MEYVFTIKQCERRNTAIYVKWLLKMLLDIMEDRRRKKYKCKLEQTTDRWFGIFQGGRKELWTNPYISSKGHFNRQSENRIKRDIHRLTYIAKNTV